VYSVKNETTQAKYALKIFNKDVSISLRLNEIELTKKLNHPSCM